MINLPAFELARKRYLPEEMPFLSELRENAAAQKKYQGLRILQNIPLTIEAVLKIEPLILGGADMTVSCISFLNPDREAVNILNLAGVKIQIEHNFENNYDLCLDCCGELYEIITPRIGSVELTQTGSEIYKKSPPDYRVVSVDDSKLKILETFFGTGDGFIRALIQITKKDIYDKKVVVFGYGKVGKGIVHRLIKFTDTIVVIEKCANARASAYKRGIKVIDSNDIEGIRKELNTAYCVVTATGIKNLISGFYNLKKDDFGKAILANMGAEDEYGTNFSEEDILFRKKPVNFSLSEPTTMKYLDPVLYAHNIGIDLIIDGKVKVGYNPFPDELAISILRKWSKFHKENALNIDEYLL